MVKDKPKRIRKYALDKHVVELSAKVELLQQKVDGIIATMDRNEDRVVKMVEDLSESLKAHMLQEYSMRMKMAGWLIITLSGGVAAMAWYIVKGG
jgi:predicted  nucleic acid-binding Zn-ribbon protein